MGEISTVQLGQISYQDYLGKCNFILARNDSFVSGVFVKIRLPF